MAKETTDEKKKGGSPLVMILAVVVVSGAAVGAGWYLGNEIRTTAAASANAQPASAKAKPDVTGQPAGSGPDGSDAQASGFSFWAGRGTLRLEPIVSNLGDSGSDWIRIEIGLVYRDGEKPAGDEESMAVTEDIIAMLRRKSIEDLSGPAAYLQFREDLNDTVRLATAGRVLNARILSMVVE